MRARPVVAAVVAAVVAVLVLWTSFPGAVGAAVPVVVVSGRGFGHGVGMAQDGAFWMGKAGATTEAILGHFYPGTTLGRAGGNPEVRVPVLTATASEVTVVLPSGGEIRDSRTGEQSAGFPVTVAAGGQVAVRWDGERYHVSGGSRAAPTSASPASGSARAAAAEPATTSSTTEPPSLLPTTTTTTSPDGSTTTTAPTAAPRTGPSSTRSLWAVPAGGATVSLPARGRSYRGVVELTAAGGTLRAVNQVDVETYLRGMGEVRDPSWPPASLRAQAIAARTYALRAMAANGELCDSQRCQVYLGSTAEYRAMDKAVADTRGQVVLHGRALASAVYSSNGGGVTATREEGFGTTGDGYPYLRSAPYTTQDPRPWTVEIGADDIVRRFGLTPPLRAVAVTRAGPSGRALEVTLTDARGASAVSGLAFARTLGLRSTLFTVDLGQAPVAPAPLAGGSVLQAEPEEAVDDGAQPIGMYFRMTRPAPTTPPPSVDLDRAKQLAAAAASAVGPEDGGRNGVGSLAAVALFLLATIALTWVALVVGGGLARPVWLRVPGPLRRS